MIPVTHPLLFESKKHCVEINGQKRIARKVNGKHISEDIITKLKLERAYAKTLAKYGVKPGDRGLFPRV